VTVLALFLGNPSNIKLRPEDPRAEARHAYRLEHLHHGQLEEDGKAVVTAAQGCMDKYCTAFLWIVPTRAAGSYKLPQG